MDKQQVVQKAEDALTEAAEFSDEHSQYAEVVKAKIELADAWMRLAKYKPH